MTKQNPISPLSKLRVQYDSLRLSEQRIADYILLNTDKIKFTSISELAKICKTSDATVVRMCKALGYSGFQEFKINLASTEGSPVRADLSLIHEDVDISDDVTTMIQKVMATNIGAIKDTMAVLDPVQTEKAIEAIRNTKRLEFFGLGGSGCVAIDAHHKFFKNNIRCIAYVDSHMQAMSAATMSKGDVVVAISNSGKTTELIHSVREAKAAGATTIAITGDTKSSLAAVSDIVLIATAKERAYKPEPMSARIAQLSVIDVLSVALSLSKLEETRETLKKTRHAVKKESHLG